MNLCTDPSSLRPTALARLRPLLLPLDPCPTWVSSSVFPRARQGRERSIRWKIISGCAGHCPDLREHVYLEAFGDKFLRDPLPWQWVGGGGVGHRITHLQQPLILCFLPTPILLPQCHYHLQLGLLKPFANLRWKLQSCPESLTQVCHAFGSPRSLPLMKPHSELGIFSPTYSCSWVPISGVPKPQTRCLGPPSPCPSFHKSIGPQAPAP